MTERYDAAIIGAGADGLAAATLLARGGARTIVLERADQPGGRLVTRQFHPGFFASPFADAVAPMPDALFRALDLARHGAFLSPPHDSVALWPDRPMQAESPDAKRLAAEASRRRAAPLARCETLEPPPSRWRFFAKRIEAEWPAEAWSHRALADLVAEHVPDSAAAALLTAQALDGRGADPLARGSALYLLTCGSGGVWRGVLGGLGAALAAAAREAGAEIRCGADVSDIRCRDGRVAALGLADGGEIAARAVISTLDVKRTFLALFPWNDLPKPAVKRIGAFRMAGSTARLLVALGERPSPMPRGTVHVAPDLHAMVAAHAAWRAGVLAERLPLSLRFASAIDPSLAPIGGAVMTVTIGCVPHAPFDGVWTHEKRDLLVRRALAQIEDVFPGLGATIVAQELLVPPDIEAALGATAGDLGGGEIAPDQMFAYRPGFAAPVEGLHLAGPSSAAGPLGLGVAGAIAARALLAERRA